MSMMTSLLYDMNIMQQMQNAQQMQNIMLSSNRKNTIASEVQQLQQIVATLEDEQQIEEINAAIRRKIRMLTR